MRLGGLFYIVPGAFREALRLTPPQTIGPFYSDKLPLDQDNDLVILSDSLTPAVNKISWISIKVLTAAGSPVCNALVEI